MSDLTEWREELAGVLLRKFQTPETEWARRDLMSDALADADALLASPAMARLLAEARAEALRAAADEMEAVIADGDCAELAAPVPGEVGRSAVVARRDALYEEPHTWLRSYARATTAHPTDDHPGEAK